MTRPVPCHPLDKQSIAPQTETIKAAKKFSLDLAPYSFIMLEYSL